MPATDCVTEAAGPLPRAERQAAVLRGAAQAFARTGYAATSMEDIAAASGITKLIVYRHFDSKEDLYRAVLQRVFDQLAEAFVVGIADPSDDAVGARALLAAARYDPGGFRLLWRHAAREPQFAAYASELREHAVSASRALLADWVAPDLAEWAAQTCVGYLVEAVLNWLEYGDAARDAEFVELATGALRSGISAWSATPSVL
ncbi:MAG TPA: TetR/AcrR family transcriptional regulator [Acidimicrobiia bacterium]|nr:TetR/AcrR family transcriptional regulator [Acidimicrobiia bacterium]